MYPRLAASLLLGATTLFPSNVAAQNGGGAVCGQIEQLQKSALAAQPSVKPVPIPIEPTLKCLQNISVNWNRYYDTSTMLTWMDKFLQFETTLDSMKDPPPDYPYPAHDLKAALAAVKEKVDSNAYANEYDFEVELFEKVYAPAHSGHLIFYPDLLTNPWFWSRTVSLVSVSADGSALPQIYFRDDILNSNSEASPLSKIDGIDAAKFIEDLVFRAAAQDPDAGYNAMFYNKAHVAAKLSNGGYFAQGGRTSNIYPGTNTSYEFANGTSVTVDNVALLRYDFTGAGNNYYFMNRYSGDHRNLNPIPIPFDAPGYPTPVVATKDGTLGGYYLQGEGYGDVAVLSVVSFSPESVVEYQAVAETFLADAVKDGKKRLVVDLSANNGGYVLSAYDLFRQLFPQTPQIGLTRARNNPVQARAVKIRPKIVSEPFDASKAGQDEIVAQQSVFNFRHDLDVEGKHFASAEAKFADHLYKESNFSALMQWDLEDPLVTVQGPTAFGTEITGYGNRTGFEQPFAAEDIIMVTDGFCSSSCFLFSDFMKNQGHVQSIAVGGRATTNPMQAVGGVKSGLLNTWDNLHSEIYRDQLTLWRKNMTDEDSEWLKANWVDHLEHVGFTASAGINRRDAIQPDHIEDGVPAQFVHEDADCRLFYTKDMIMNVENVWKKVVGAAWNGDKCVSGGLTRRNAKTESRRREETGGATQPVKEVKTKWVDVVRESVDKDEAWQMRHGRKAFE